MLYLSIIDIESNVFPNKPSNASVLNINVTVRATSAIIPSRADTHPLWIHILIPKATTAASTARNQNTNVWSDGRREARLLIKYVKIIITPDATAAITWLSVRDDINRPIAIYADPRRKKPNALP